MSILLQNDLKIHTMDEFIDKMHKLLFFEEVE